jgi:hypothetical protein
MYVGSIPPDAWRVMWNLWNLLHGACPATRPDRLSEFCPVVTDIVS